MDGRDQFSITAWAQKKSTRSLEFYFLQKTWISFNTGIPRRLESCNSRKSRAYLFRRFVLIVITINATTIIVVASALYWCQSCSLLQVIQCHSFRWLRDKVDMREDLSNHITFIILPLFKHLWFWHTSYSRSFIPLTNAHCTWKVRPIYFRGAPIR